MNYYNTNYLKDIVDINPAESLKKGTVAKKIGMDILQPYTRSIPSYTFEPFSGGTKFRNGDTIMARITPCLENGKTAMVSILDKDEIGFGSTEYIVFRAKEGITDPFFIYYLVTSSEIREPAIKSMVGSSGRQRVQTDVIANLTIKLPPLPIQQKIAAILSSLDDKIELNNKINENLEQQAQALFKSWFIDFEPFGGKMPEGWKELTLDYFCNVFTGRKNANASVENGKYKFFTCSPDPLPIDSFIYDGDAIIISGNGAYTGRTRFYSGKFDLYQRTYACTIKNDINPNYMFILYWIVKFVLSKKIMGGTHGSAIPYIVMDDITKFVINFDETVFDSLSKTMKSFVQQIQENEKQNEQLSLLRDTLLPKLMNGEIEV
ncbi:MAG: restriction endonuclease subunit S [Treponema sp.]|nr:restriction endonuclease subunit S [Treponema sp.]